ncbi:hypothetical protein AOXY_G36148, partial [Acipenser oxyrinchus oxyrinchus]
MRGAGLQLSCFCWRIGPHTAGKGAMIKVLPSPPVEFLRISDRDLTEIELHSVESISDLQRLNSNSELLKTPPGGCPPRHQDNGNLPARPRLACSALAPADHAVPAAALSAVGTSGCALRSSWLAALRASSTSWVRGTVTLHSQDGI